MRISIFTLFLFIRLLGFSQVESDSSETVIIPRVPTVKHILSLDGIISYPRRYLSQNRRDNYLYKQYLNWGARLSYIYSPSNSFGFGVEYGFDISKINLEFGYSTFSSLITNDALTIRHEGMSLVVHNIMPKIEWKRKNAKRPYGVSHQFGLGVTLSHVLENNYNYKLMCSDKNNQTDIEYFTTCGDHDYDDAEETFDVNQLYNYDNGPFLGGSIMYTLMYRGQLSESVLWSIGIRTQLNLTSYNFIRETAQFDMEDTMYWITRREMEKLIAINRLQSLMHVQFGVTYKLTDK